MCLYSIDRSDPFDPTSGDSANIVGSQPSKTSDDLSLPPWPTGGRFEIRERKGIIIPGPGGIPLTLGPSDFLHNLCNFIRGGDGPKTTETSQWNAEITDFTQRWKITFRSDGRTSIRVFCDNQYAADDALTTITQAAERAFPVDPRLTVSNSNFSLRVVSLPNSEQKVVMARELPTEQFVRALVERLFETELGLHEPCVEQFRFKIPGLQLFHQNSPRTVDVHVSYRYSNARLYPDFLRLDEVVKAFFCSYPKSDAYWEELNRDLVTKLLKDFPTLESLAVTVMVRPDEAIHSTRASTVAMHRAHLALEDAA